MSKKTQPSLRRGKRGSPGDIARQLVARSTLLGFLVMLGIAPLLAHALEVVTVIPPSALQLKPGGGAQIRFQIVVKPGYHVQANPVENPSLIPITLKVDASDSISVGEPMYPAAKRMRLPGDSQDLVVYDGSFAIALPVEVSRAATAGDVTLQGRLRYQACDDSHCLFPVTLPVTLTVVVKSH